MMLIARVSNLTGTKREKDLPVTTDQMIELADPNGRHIQQIFPDLSAEDREWLKTGITGEEWDSMFTEEQME